MKFKDLKSGDFVESYILVQECKLRYTINQTPYYGLTISDGELTMDARIWDINLKKDIVPGNIYKVSAKINDFGGRLQAIISMITDVNPDEVDWRDFFRFAPLSEEEIRIGINTYLNKIKNPIINKVVTNLLAQVEKAFYTFPGGISMHHNYLSGLSYHTLSMLRLADTFIINYPSLNQDLLYGGIILHDIGKTKELTEAKTPSYSQQGNILGHLIIGLQMLTTEANTLGLSETEEVQALSHLLIAHHGELEFGSAKEPLMMEAQALYLIDLTDSKLAPIHDEVSKTPKGSYTNSILTLNRRSLYVPKI